MLTCGQSKKSAEIRKMLGVPPTLGRDPGQEQGTLIRESSLKKYSQEDTPTGRHDSWILMVRPDFDLFSFFSSSTKLLPNRH